VAWIKRVNIHFSINSPIYTSVSTVVSTIQVLHKNFVYISQSPCSYMPHLTMQDDHGEFKWLLMSICSEIKKSDNKQWALN
jgi:hypothetical protein